MNVPSKVDVGMGNRSRLAHLKTKSVIWNDGTRVKVIGKGHRVKINRFPPLGTWKCTAKFTSSLFGRAKQTAVHTFTVSLYTEPATERDSWDLLSYFPTQVISFLLLHPSLLYILPYPTMVNGEMIDTAFMFRCYLFMWQTYHRLPVQQWLCTPHFAVAPGSKKQPSAH